MRKLYKNDDWGTHYYSSKIEGKQIIEITYGFGFDETVLTSIPESDILALAEIIKQQQTKL